MRLYQLILEVPDSFNPDSTEIMVKAQSDEPISVMAEGFLELNLKQEGHTNEAI